MDMQRLITEKILQFAFFYYLLQVAMSATQVVYVTRDVSDSFRLEGYSCIEDGSRGCSVRNAVCQLDGSCSCSNTTPDYVNPKFIVVYGYLKYGSSDGCVSMTPLISSVDQDNLPCSYSFGPYQVIPNRPSTIASKFNHAAAGIYTWCNFTSALAKHPGEKTWTTLTWFNKSYINLSVEYPGYLYFQWKMSVPMLHGLMIVMNLNCSRKYEAYGNVTMYSKQCVRAKVLGTTSSIAPTTLACTLLFHTVFFHFLIQLT